MWNNLDIKQTSTSRAGMALKITLDYGVSHCKWGGRGGVSHDEFSGAGGPTINLASPRTHRPTRKMTSRPDGWPSPVHTSMIIHDPVLTTALYASTTVSDGGVATNTNLISSREEQACCEEEWPVASLPGDPSQNPLGKTSGNKHFLPSLSARKSCLE